MAPDQEGVIGNSLRPEVVPNPHGPTSGTIPWGITQMTELSEHSPNPISVLNYFPAVVQELKQK